MGTLTFWIWINVLFGVLNLAAGIGDYPGGPDDWCPWWLNLSIGIANCSVVIALVRKRTV